MIHVVSHVNRHLYTSILEDMFELRHKVFVEDRGWEKLRRSDGRDVDEFDTDDAVYFLKLDDELRILGGLRVYKTTLPTQLNTIFKGWCTLRPAPVETDHYEWSRYFITDLNYRSKTGKPIHCELFTAVLEWGVANNIRSYSGFVDMPTFNHIAKLPWDLHQLGHPTQYGGANGEPLGQGIAMQVMIDNLMYRRTKAVWRMRKPVLSLSLGDLTPVQEIGYQAHVVQEVQKFLGEHPEHIDIIADIAALLQNIDPECRAEIHSALSTIEERAEKTEFSEELLQRVTTSHISIAAQ